MACWEHGWGIKYECQSSKREKAGQVCMGCNNWLLLHNKPLQNLVTKDNKLLLLLMDQQVSWDFLLNWPWPVCSQLGWLMCQWSSDRLGPGWLWIASLPCWQLTGCQLGVEMMCFSSYSMLAWACSHSGSRKKVQTHKATEDLGLELACHHFCSILSAIASHKAASFNGQGHLLMGYAVRSCCKGHMYRKGWIIITSFAV